MVIPAYLALLASMLAADTNHPLTTVTVLDQPLAPSVRVGDVIFEVNEKLGRAWVALHLDDTVLDIGGDGVSGSSRERALVPGLRYDAEKRQILFHDGSRERLCATAARGFFRGLAFRPAVGCALAVRREERQIDDGFMVSPRSFVVVELHLSGD